MTVGIALMLLPLLTDYPLQSKHLFLSRKMQLYAVRDIQAPCYLPKVCQDVG